MTEPKPVEILGKRRCSPLLVQPATTKKLKRSQKFINALSEMRQLGLGDGNDDKKRRVSVYKKHEMTTDQWGECYKEYIKKLPLAALVHLDVTKSSDMTTSACCVVGSLKKQKN
jgi:hypothetical protein